jgi:AICAR transformylase/IMP cyclohydrolase PurH
MSRIDSVSLALAKAKVHQHEVQGAVAASDAFFPFPDGLEELAKAGVRAVVAPRGAKRDQDTIEAANRFGISLLFVADRHFRH